MTIGPTEEQIFRNNVAWAKMTLTPDRLQVLYQRFRRDGVPTSPSPMEQAAIELLGRTTDIEIDADLRKLVHRSMSFEIKMMHDLNKDI